MSYDTQILPSTQEGIKTAAQLLRSGETVAIPTETVYGLAGNALDPKAAEKIFAAKGRPMDNPLIVHIAEFDDIYNYVTRVNENAVKLAEAFWPGPLTMIFPKKDCIPDATSGGLDTVGIRFPVNRTARDIIRACGFPLAAPSANLSGSPSPTELRHVYKDMNGRIPAIVDGGACTVGVESTVVSFDDDGRVCLLRPGFVSLEEIQSIVGEDNAFCAKGVTERIGENERVLSPGMKYKHYAPAADIAIIDADEDSFIAYVNEHAREGCGSLIFGNEADRLSCAAISFGMTSEEQARRLFSALRELDERDLKRVYARCPSRTGVGLAVYNRLLRAAGFEVIVP